MTNKRTDVLVIGSGIAGLIFALKTARYFPDVKVTIITKDNESESNTKYAQGGIAVVKDFKRDSFKKHIKDTLKAGDGLCNPLIVELVIKDGPERLKELIAWGSAFDKKNAGEFDLRREGGHSADRIVHHKDITGLEIERTLLSLVHDTPNIELLTHQFAIDLITEKYQGNHIPNAICCGAYLLNSINGKIYKILTRITLLATGGAGQVYLNTTNSHIATGDGIAMAYNAGCKIENMEFIQFHPTMLYHPKDKSTFLISEAVRGAGAVLKTKAGKTFMEKYDRRSSLAPRDIVARAIESEMKSRGEKHVCLDCRMLDKSEFMKHFPNIFSKCYEIGIDITKDMIPVVPAAHYTCGGVVVDSNSQTDLDGLYAIGETSYTGLHGA
ncbi:MAG: FAD-binding protein, partial [Bacteroidetes bacterium]|nr:FAD-binding protein [Bacteroidota bacterium]